MIKCYFIESKLPLIIQMETGVIHGKNCEKICLEIDGTFLRYTLEFYN